MGANLHLGSADLLVDALHRLPPCQQELAYLDTVGFLPQLLKLTPCRLTEDVLPRFSLLIVPGKPSCHLEGLTVHQEHLSIGDGLLGPLQIVDGFLQK